MASPLRFRFDPGGWSDKRVRRELYQSLDDYAGVTWVEPEHDLHGWDAARFELDNGDLALFAWRDGEAYWLGNTETPSALWKTNKRGWEEVPFELARWARRELVVDLYDRAPWLADYEYLTWFFLPVLMSKDGTETALEFFKEHAAGFPNANREAGLDFYDEFLKSGVLEAHRETMAGKLGTSGRLDLTRMRAAMGEFTVAKLLHDAGYDLEPEIELGSGYALDYRVDDTLVEVARPQPPARRTNANTPIAAVRETARSKGRGQLDTHAGALLVVDCTSFPDDAWRSLRAEHPDLPYQPTLVIRARPDRGIEGFEVGNVPIDVSEAVALPN
ncbi:DUF5784 family protein [Salinarchaeum chitinilyticum]